MGKYKINGSTYQIDDAIQGEDLRQTLRAIARPGAPSSGKADIDDYLDETDDLLGLTPGTSSRQIHQESKFDPKAVNPRTRAAGLAQVMPKTLETISARFKRKLDPHNEKDALEIHRELMRENMKRWGNEDDALRAYNAGWDPKAWKNKETEGYIEIIKGNKAAAAAAGAPKAVPEAAPAGNPRTPFGPVRETADPATLHQDPDWLRASRQLYSLRERQSFTGSDADLAEYGKGLMGNFNSNMVDMARYAADLARNGSDEDKQSFLFLMDTYDNLQWSWEGAGRAAKGIFTDPTNLIGLGTLGIATVPKVMASAAAKQGVKKLLLTALGRTGIIAGVEGAALGAAENSIRQGVEVTAGRRESVSLLEVAGGAATGAAAGVVLGTAGDAALSAISQVVRRHMPRKAAAGPVQPRIEPTLDAAPSAAQVAPTGSPAAASAIPPGKSAVASGATPGAPASVIPEGAAGVADAAPTPNLVPGTVLSDGDIAAATARQQKGRLWVDDLPPVEGANPIAASRIEVPDSNTGLRSTPRSMEELTADGGKIADQLRNLDDRTMHGVLESFRQGSLPLEESRVIARGVQMHADELRIEQADLIKKLGLSTNAQETVQMMQRLDALESRLVPLSLADDAFGSMAGSMLRQRQEGLPGMQGVTVESLMAEKGLTKDAAEDLYVKLIEGSKQDFKVQQIAQKYDSQITDALKRGDNLEAAMLTTMKQRELAAVVELEMPGSASFSAKALEFVISNVFTPTTVMINLVPAAVKTMVLPFAKALVTDPLQRATRVEMAASYSAMRATFGMAFRAAKAAYRYEQSMVTRGTGRILEGEMALTGKAAGYIRFFPRVLNSTDEFLAQINYAGFVSGQAAGNAALDGAERGLKGKELTAHIKEATKRAMAEAYTQPSGEALVQPLINKGVNLGLTGEKLLQYVEREALRDPDALRHGSNEEALDMVRDVLYKRKFSGDGAASGVAQSFEQMTNRVPALKLLVGQLFFRTPIRVFEEGIRLTPGLQIIAPNFIGDLAGKNGAARQARANAEAMASLAITGAVLSLYASGKVTGDGAYDNWKAQRTAGDGPGAPAYTLKMSDGSTWSYRSFDPVATPIKIMINGLERLDKLAIRQAQGELIDKGAWEQGVAYITTGTSAIAMALRDANLVAGIDQGIKMLEALGDPEDKGDAVIKMFGEKLALLVPNTLHKLAKQNDPTIKDPADFWQVVETRLAALHVDREDIKTAYSYDVLGAPRRLTDTGTLWNIFSTASVADREKSKSPEALVVMTELDRLQKETGAVFAAPLKHRMLGDFDLRTTLTGDGKETLYDRWQAKYRALEPERILYPIVTAEMPDGTFKNKSLRGETVTKVMNELRDAAFMQVMAEEQKVIDKVIELEVGKAKAKAGLLDFSNRDK